MCGGASEAEKADSDTIVVCNEVRDELEGKVGSKFSEYTPLLVRKQVVAGTNFFVKIHVGNGDHVHVRIFRSLPHAGSKSEVHSHQAGKTADDSLEYFWLNSVFMCLSIAHE